jgi:putative transposase
MIDAAHPQLSIRHQCALLDLAPSTYYHKAQPTDADDLEIMRAIDQQYLETPFYGVERMTWALREAGHVVNEKRVRRLMRLMALEAIYPKPRTSHPGRTGTHYPYLLKGLKIDQPDHVWATDITYIPLRRGYCYLTAIMDWATRYVIAWEISNTLDALFCIETLQRALATGRQPQILNTDQGAQYTCADYVDRVVAAGIRPSWDGRGAGWTMFSWSDFGAATSMNGCIGTPGRRPKKRGTAVANTLNFTTTDEGTRHWTKWCLRQYISKSPKKSRPDQPEAAGPATPPLVWLKRGEIHLTQKRNTNTIR